VSASGRASGYRDAGGRPGRFVAASAVVAIAIALSATSWLTGVTSASLNAQTRNPTNVIGNASLGAPTLAVPTVNGTGATATVSLSWTSPGGDLANQWQVLRAAGACPGGSFSTIATPSVTNYTDTPGAAATYCYAVKGKLGAWTSVASNQQTVTVSPTLPALVQKAHNETAGAAGSINATFASAPAQSRLLVAIVGERTNVTIVQPAGWSTAINQPGGPGQAIFYKVAGASEPSSLTVSLSGGTTRLGLQLYEFSGVASVSPLDATASATGNSATPASGNATTTQAIELLIAGEVVQSPTSVSAWTNSFVEQNDNTNGGASNRAQYGGATRIVQATGTYSTAATAAASANWRGQIATFKAAP
jgi:hypothetical protein